MEQGRCETAVDEGIELVPVFVSSPITMDQHSIYLSYVVKLA